MILSLSDLAPFAKIANDRAEAMIADAEATAAMVAPCILSEEFLASETRVAQARSILRGAVLRWNDAGSGAVTQASAGSFSQSVDTRTARSGMFWPSEITQLRELCAEFTQQGRGEAGGVSMIADMRPSLADRPDLIFQWGP